MLTRQTHHRQEGACQKSPKCVIDRGANDKGVREGKAGRWTKERWYLWVVTKSATFKKNHGVMLMVQHHFSPYTQVCTKPCRWHPLVDDAFACRQQGEVDWRLADSIKSLETDIIQWEILWKPSFRVYLPPCQWHILAIFWHPLQGFSDFRGWERKLFPWFSVVFCGFPDWLDTAYVNTHLLLFQNMMIFLIRKECWSF